MCWWKRSEVQLLHDGCGDGETYFVACCVGSTAVVVGAPVAFHADGCQVRVFCDEVDGRARSHLSKVVAYTHPLASV
ncbi:unnamed protein product [Ectocarpus sp. 8 AP-2014]